jgi:Fic family protein
MYKNKIEKIDLLQKEINNFRPLKKRELSSLRKYFKIGLTYSSNSIEGNSLTETETKIILEDGITIGGRPLREHFEVIGHGMAYDEIFKLSTQKTIQEKDILKLHKLFYYHIDILEAGKYRKDQVFISGTRFIPPSPEKIPALMKKFGQSITKMQQKYHPVEFAAWLHLEFVTIHPFIDGNGRTARLLMNLALLQAGFVITIIPPVLRNDYIQILKSTQTGKKDFQKFFNFISCMVYESQKDFLRLLNTIDLKP